jgi:hypothetical protein
MTAGARLSDDAVHHFHSQLDSQAYDDIVGNSDEAFQNSANHDELTKFLSGVHSKLGSSHGFTRTNIFVNATTNGNSPKSLTRAGSIKGTLPNRSPGKKQTVVSNSSATMSSQMHL